MDAAALAVEVAAGVVDGGGLESEPEAVEQLRESSALLSVLHSDSASGLHRSARAMVKHVKQVFAAEAAAEVGVVAAAGGRPGSKQGPSPGAGALPAERRGGKSGH